MNFKLSRELYKIKSKTQNLEPNMHLKESIYDLRCMISSKAISRASRNKISNSINHIEIERFIAQPLMG
jgi:hypothetical protein